MKWTERHHAEWQRKEKEKDTKGSCVEQRHYNSLCCPLSENKLHNIFVLLICLEQLMAEWQLSNYFNIRLSHQPSQWQTVWNSIKLAAVSVAKLIWLKANNRIGLQKEITDTMQNYVYFVQFASHLKNSIYIGETTERKLLICALKLIYVIIILTMMVHKHL